MQEQVKNILATLKKDSNLRALKSQKHSKLNISQDSQKWLLNLASNDYLGLARNDDFNTCFLDSKIFREFCEFSSSSSRLLSGNFEINAHLEAHLKDIFKKDVLLFNSGYHANVGILSALSKLRNVLFVADKSIHASCLDGLKGFKPPKLKRFSHNNMESLSEILEQNTDKYEAIVILSEGIFSIEGDFTPLKELVALKAKFKNVYLYIDEAHSIGSFGDDGLGISSHFGLLENVDFVILTFGKALASMGACVLCSETFREYFINTSRSLIYSTALPPVNVARSLFCFLEIPRLFKERENLKNLSLSFKKMLEGLDLRILGDYNIISIVLGSNEKAVHFANALFKCGYFAPAIKSPTVPKNMALLRFSICADMDLESLQDLAKCLKKIQNAHL